MDEDADRDPETQASINKRREYRAELAEGYRRAKEEADDSGWHDVLEPTEHPSRTEPVPLWEVIDTRASHTRRFDDDPFDPLAATISREVVPPDREHPPVSGAHTDREKKSPLPVETDLDDRTPRPQRLDLRLLDVASRNVHHGHRPRVVAGVLQRLGHAVPDAVGIVLDLDREDEVPRLNPEVGVTAGLVEPLLVFDAHRIELSLEALPELLNERRLGEIAHRTVVSPIAARPITAYRAAIDGR